MPPRLAVRFLLTAAALLVALPAFAFAANGADVRDLTAQNQRLQEQVQAQQKVIEELSAQLARLAAASERHERELRTLQAREPGAEPAGATLGRDQEVRIAAEGAITFFHTGREGRFPKGEFRADDPVITLEAPVMKNTYFFTELKLLPRDTNAEDFELGEMYVDIEDVSSVWGQPGLLSLRAGRLNIPFGEEYQRRSPVTNPLISHSLSDIWGVDEGLGIYGRVGPARYILAVQNGGVSRLRDYHADKSVTGRLSWEPASWMGVSVSAMRTGKLSSTGDTLSEVWFGGAFFRALGPSGRTTSFWAELYEADVMPRWKTGQATLALGQARFDDSDPIADNARRIRYGYLELVQRIAGRLYGATRYSEIRVARGYPLAGWGSMGTFFFRPSLTEELRRLSLGVGYRFGPPLVWKVEYSWESGRMVNGARRDLEDFFGTQLGMKF